MTARSPLRARRTRILAAAAACAVLASTASAAEAPREIVIPGDRVFPESLTSTRDGTVYVGSLARRAIYRAAPGEAVAASWLDPGAHGLDGVLGVYADERGGLLWACSTKIDVSGKAPPAESALFAFDLRTGAVRGRYPLPGEGAVCNDIAVDADGAVYATDSTNMRVVRLARGASALEAWAGTGEFGGKDDVLDGIAVLGRRVVVNVYRTGRLYAVPIERGGRAGAIAELALDRRLEMPDGMRADGAGALLVAETGGGGRLSRVRVSGAHGRVQTLASGFPDGAVAVTRVGPVAYVLEGQLDRLFGADAPARPFRATRIDLGRGRADGQRP